MKRERWICGNWKMNKTCEEARDFLTELLQKLPPLREGLVVACAVPATALAVAASTAANSPIYIGGQTLHEEPFGAYTGEISGKMLREAGASFVVVGHSERRRYFNETNECIAKKAVAALAAGLRPIICVGENQLERDTGEALQVVERQLNPIFSAVSKAAAHSRLLIAYEPVWAIGTGKTATTSDVSKMHHHIRKTVAAAWGEECAQSLSCLYGGSVTPANSGELLKQEEVDGFLIGGASLDVASFSTMISHAAKA